MTKVVVQFEGNFIIKQNRYRTETLNLSETTLYIKRQEKLFHCQGENFSREFHIKYLRATFNVFAQRIIKSSFSCLLNVNASARFLTGGTQR